MPNPGTPPSSEGANKHTCRHLRSKSELLLALSRKLLVVLQGCRKHIAAVPACRGEGWARDSPCRSLSSTQAPQQPQRSGPTRTIGPGSPRLPGSGGAVTSPSQGLRTTPLWSRGLSPPEHTEQPEAGDEEQSTHSCPAAREGRSGVRCAKAPYETQRPEVLSWGLCFLSLSALCPRPLTLAVLGLHPTRTLPQALF